jgi:hypothetical protein
MRVIDVTGYLLLLAGDLDAEEDDGEPPAVEDLLLPFCEEVEEGIALAVGDGGCEGLGLVLGEVELGLLDGLLLGYELLAGEDLGLGVVSLGGGRRTSSLSWRASSMSPRYIRSSFVMCESRYSS